MKSTITFFVALALLFTLVVPTPAVHGEDHKVFFSVNAQYYIEEPATSTCIDVLAGNLSEEEVTLLQVDIFGKNRNKPLLTIPVGKELTKIATSYTPKECKDLIFATPETAYDEQELENFFAANHEKLYYAFEEIDLTNLMDEVKPGKQFFLSAIGIFEIGGKRVEIADTSFGYYAPIPNIAKGITGLGEDTAGILAVPNEWSKGDMHVHTLYSDGVATPYEQVQAMNNVSGGTSSRKALVLADHNDWMDANEWNLRNGDITSAVSSYPNVTCSGCLELTTSSNNHCITVGLTNFISGPNTLASYISTLNSQGALGGPTHPNSAYAWSDSDLLNTGIKIAELGNAGTYHQGNIDKWDLMLRSNINSTVPGGTFEVGLGGSDAHLATPVGKGITWLRNISSSVGSIKTAVNSRRASFAFITKTWSDLTLNSNSTNYVMGSTNAVINGNVTLTIQHEAIGDVSNQIENVRIVKYDTVSGTTMTYDMLPTSSTSTTKVISPTDPLYPRDASKGYYRVEITVLHSNNITLPYRGKAYTNPIFFSKS